LSGLGKIKNLFRPSWHLVFWKSIWKEPIFRRLFKNSSYLLFSTVVTSVLGLVQAIIVARSLGVSNYGLLALVTAYVATIKQLVDFRVWETVIKYLSEFWVNGDKARAMATVKLAYWIDSLTGILAFGIIVLGAPSAARLLHQPMLSELAWILALSSVFATINGTSNAILRVFNRFKWIAIQQIVQGMVSLGLVLLVVALGYGLKGIVAAYVLTAFIGALILTSFSLKVIHQNMWNVRREGRISLLRDRYRELGWFLFHTNMSAFWGMLVRRFDVLILGYFGTTVDVGYFKLAKNFVTVLAKLHDPIYNSVFPEISKLWALGDVREFNRFLKKLTLIMGSIFVPLGLGVFFLCGLVIRWTVGPDFAPAALAVQIMVWGVTIRCVLMGARPTIIAIGRPEIGHLAIGTGAILYLGLSIIVVPLWGYLGTATMSLIPGIVANAIMLGVYVLSMQKIE